MYKSLTRIFEKHLQIIQMQCVVKSPKTRSVGNYQRLQFNVAHNEHLTNLRDHLQKQEQPPSVTEWRTLRNEVLTSCKHIKEVNVDAFIISLCEPETQLRVAQSYISFLKTEGKSPNYATIGRVLRMYYPAYRNGQLMKEDEEEILKIYRNLREKHEVLDEITCENLISALIITPQWHETLTLLDMIKLTSQPSLNAYSMIIAKAFESSNNMELGWRLLQEICDIGKQPKCEIFIQYWNTIKSDPKTFNRDLDKMLQFIGDNNILVSRNIINELQNILLLFNIESKITKITNVGRCNNCNLNLPKVSITANEFSQLSSSFLEKVLIRKDVFVKSSPAEVEEFIRFVDKTAPYDCVIDGLNVAYSGGVRKSNAAYAKTLALVVKYFKDRRKNVLVLGRQHMSKWPQEQMTYIRQKSNLFLTSDLSQDDPFLLYAALKSGPHADFVSRDLMRSHAHLLGGELKQIFRRWQQQHQYMLKTTTGFGKVIIQDPIKYSLTAKRINSTWHIPFTENYSFTRSESFEIPESWLCLSTGVI